MNLCEFNGFHIFDIIWFNVGCKHGYVSGSCHGYFMYLLLIIKWVDERPN